MAMATWPSSPPGGTLFSVLLLLVFAFAHVGQTAAPNARPACPECGESPASVTTLDPGFVADPNPSGTSKEFVRFTGPADTSKNDAGTTTVVEPVTIYPTVYVGTTVIVVKTVYEDPADSPSIHPTIYDTATYVDPAESPSIFTTIYVDPLPPMPDSRSQASPPAPPVETSVVVESPAAPPPPCCDQQSPCCNQQPPADPAPSPSSQVAPPQAPSPSTPVEAPPATTSIAQVSPPAAPSVSSQSAPAVAPSVITITQGPTTAPITATQALETSRSEVLPADPSSSSQMPPPAAPIPSPETSAAVISSSSSLAASLPGPSSVSEALPPSVPSSSSNEPSQVAEPSIIASSSSSQVPQSTTESASDTRPDEAAAPQSTETPSVEVTTSSSVVSSPTVATTPISIGQPESTEVAQPETPSTIASSIGEDEQVTSEAPPPKSSEVQSDAPAAISSSATPAGQSSSETSSSKSEQAQPVGTQTEQPEPSKEPSQKGTQKEPSSTSQKQTQEKPASTSKNTPAKSTSSEEKPAPTSKDTPAKSTSAKEKPASTSKDTPAKSTSAREKPATSTTAGSSKSGTTAAKTSGEGKPATASPTTGPSPSGTEGSSKPDTTPAKTSGGGKSPTSESAGTTANTTPSSSAGGELTTHVSNTKSSGSSVSASSSSSSSTDGCNPNANEDEDDGGHGSSNALLDLVTPPTGGWLKAAGKWALEAIGYNPDTGKEDTRPPCPTETGTEDEEEEEEDDDDDDDDDDILPPPPPGGVGGGGGGGSKNWPKPPGPPPPGVNPGPLGDQNPYRRPTPKPGPKPSPEGGVKTEPVPPNPGNTQNPEPEPTIPPDPNCTPIAFNAGCVQDCTSFSYTRPNATTTWTECGGEECSLETGCRPTPALTETSWTTRTCSKTITQTDVCKQACTEYVSPLSSTSDYTTETRCASSVTCWPTVVCEEQEPTTTTSYTTKTEAPTHACYATEKDLEARLIALGEKAARLGNASEPGALQKRQTDEYNLLDFNRLTSSNDLQPDEWFRKWRQEFETKGVGSPSMAFAQYKDDDFLPNHAVYMPLRDLPAGTGIRNMAGCSAVVIASPHGVYVGHFWEIPTFRAPDLSVYPWPLQFDYSDRQDTFDRRVTNFLQNGNMRWYYEYELMVEDYSNPASPALADLAMPGGPFHKLKTMDWYYIAFIHPRENYNENQRGNGDNFWVNQEAWAEWRDAIRRTLSPNGDHRYFKKNYKNYKQLGYSSLKHFRRFPQYANIEEYFDQYPGKNALIVQYAPAVPNPNNPGGRPSRQLRITFNEKTVFAKTWCAPPAGEMLPLPQFLPDNTGLNIPAPQHPPPGAVRLVARQEADEPEEMEMEEEMETLTCPMQPWKVCAVDVAQTVVPTMGPSIQGTIDVTDEMGQRAHLKDFDNVPFGGFVSSEPEDNHLGYNLTMRFDGEWDKFLLDKGYACNCTADACDMYSAQCCLQNNCPKCNCADGVCPAGSPACCQDNSCNATRPREPTDYPFKAWDVKVAIQGEKGALGEEQAWAKDVSCTTTKWDHLNETVVDGYCMAHRQMRCTWVCDQFDDDYESSLEWMELDVGGNEE